MSIRDKLAPVGDAWNLEATVGVIREKRHERNDKRRFLIAVSVLAGIAIGAAGLAAMGFWRGRFDPLIGFWAATGPTFGAIIGYYFGKNGDTS